MVTQKAIRSLVPCAFWLLLHSAISLYTPHICSEIMLLYHGGMNYTSGVYLDCQV